VGDFDAPPLREGIREPPPLPLAAPLAVDVGTAGDGVGAADCAPEGVSVGTLGAGVRVRGGVLVTAGEVERLFAALSREEGEDVGAAAVGVGGAGVGVGASEGGGECEGAPVGVPRAAVDVPSIAAVALAAPVAREVADGEKEGRGEKEVEGDAEGEDSRVGVGCSVDVGAGERETEGVYTLRVGTVEGEAPQVALAPLVPVGVFAPVLVAVACIDGSGEAVEVSVAGALGGPEGEGGPEALARELRVEDGLFDAVNEGAPDALAPALREAEDEARGERDAEGEGWGEREAAEVDVDSPLRVGESGAEGEAGGERVGTGGAVVVSEVGAEGEPSVLRLAEPDAEADGLSRGVPVPLSEAAAGVGVTPLTEGGGLRVGPSAGVAVACAPVAVRGGVAVPGGPGLSLPTAVELTADEGEGGCVGAAVALLPGGEAVPPGALRDAVKDTKVAPGDAVPEPLAQGGALPLAEGEDEALGERNGDFEAAGVALGASGLPVGAGVAVGCAGVRVVAPLPEAVVVPVGVGEGGAEGESREGVGAPEEVGLPEGGTLCDGDGECRALRVARALLLPLPEEDWQPDTLPVNVTEEVPTVAEGDEVSAAVALAAGERLAAELPAGEPVLRAVAHALALLDSEGNTVAVAISDKEAEMEGAEGEGSGEGEGKDVWGGVGVGAPEVVAMPTNEPVDPKVKNVGSVVVEMDSVGGAVGEVGGVPEARGVATSLGEMGAEAQPLAVDDAVVLPQREGNAENRKLPEAEADAESSPLALAPPLCVGGASVAESDPPAREGVGAPDDEGLSATEHEGAGVREEEGVVVACAEGEGEPEVGGEGVGVTEGRGVGVAGAEPLALPLREAQCEALRGGEGVRGGENVGSAAVGVPGSAVPDGEEEPRAEGDVEREREGEREEEGEPEEEREGEDEGVAEPPPPLAEGAGLRLARGEADAALLVEPLREVDAERDGEGEEQGEGCGVADGAALRVAGGDTDAQLLPVALTVEEGVGVAHPVPPLLALPLRDAQEDDEGKSVALPLRLQQGDGVAVPDTPPLRVAEPLVEGLSESAAERLPQPEGEGDGDGEGDAEGERVPLRLPDGDREPLWLPDGEGDGKALPVRVAQSVGPGEALPEGDASAVGEGEAQGLGDVLPEPEGVSEALPET
jgi:hypothetical protein